jgi:hypothetical protein
MKINKKSDILPPNL